MRRCIMFAAVALTLAALFSAAAPAADPQPKAIVTTLTERADAAGVWISPNSNEPYLFASVYATSHNGPVIGLADYRDGRNKISQGMNVALFLNDGVPTMQVSKPGKPVLFVDLYDFAEAVNAKKSALKPPVTLDVPLKTSSYAVPRNLTPDVLHALGTRNAAERSELLSPMNNRGTFEPLVFYTRLNAMDGERDAVRRRLMFQR